LKLTEDARRADGKSRLREGVAEIKDMVSNLHIGGGAGRGSGASQEDSDSQLADLKSLIPREKAKVSNQISSLEKELSHLQAFNRDMTE